MRRAVVAAVYDRRREENTFSLSGDGHRPPLQLSNSVLPRNAAFRHSLLRPSTAAIQVNVPVRVKICGITNLEDAQVAVEAGADALGFILYEKSKRFIPIEDAIRIVEKLPPFVQTVAVTVNATREFSNLGWRKQLKNFGVAQLHGQESPVHAKAVSKYLPVIKVFPADQAASMTPESYWVSAFMLDTPSQEHGGTGRVYDWNLAVEFKKLVAKPLILSGGLNPENVAKAIETVQPYAVDVASGVEASLGRKDHARLREFIRICKSF